MSPKPKFLVVTVPPNFEQKKYATNRWAYSNSITFLPYILELV